MKVADDSSETPISVVSFALVAGRLIKDGRPADAERLLLRGVCQHPNEFVLNTQLGSLLRARGNWPTPFAT